MIATYRSRHIFNCCQHSMTQECFKIHLTTSLLIGISAFSNFCYYSEILNNAIHFLYVPEWVFFVTDKFKNNWVKEFVLLNVEYCISHSSEEGKHKYHKHYENKGFIIVIIAYINVGWNFCYSGKRILLAMCTVNVMDGIYRNN